MGRDEVLGGISAAQDGVVTRAQALRAGFSRHEIDNLVAFKRWLPLARAVYQMDPRVEPSRRARIRAAVLSFGSAAHAVLGTAAELHGIAGLPVTERIHLALPARAARPVRFAEPHIVVHQLRRSAVSLLSVDGIPVTSPLDTVTDVILRERRYPAVCLLDSALNRGLVTDDDLLAIPRLIRGRRGAVAARGYLAEVDARAQSPLETRARLRCVDGRVPPDVLQWAVRDRDGYLLGVGDLGWRASRVIAEADGRAPHSTPDAIFADRRRQNRLANAGYTVLRFTWHDTLDPNYIPWTVRQAISAASMRRS
ncbi:DUF559 domain-containing protein [Micromonospora psammae]|uniref:DUF559 domain-containing protein n=1 Tax=Micromonospora sp. CPCC 205556 TaxID=3122398 RepID=UPI002FF2A1A5